MPYHWRNNPHPPLLSPHLFPHFPTMSDLTILLLFNPIFACSSQRYNSIMDVHKPSIHFSSLFNHFSRLIHSLCLLPWRMFLWRRGRTLSVFTLLTHSFHQPDTQPLWQIAPICLSVPQCMRKRPGYILFLHTPRSLATLHKNRWISTSHQKGVASGHIGPSCRSYCFLVKSAH